MDKSLTTLLLTVGGLIGAIAVLALVYPSIVQVGTAIAADRAGISAQSQESIAVVNALSELDAWGNWQDTDADSSFDLYVWVKNNGGATISKIDGLDVFVFHGGISERIPNAADAGGTYPQWNAEVEGGGDWLVGKTLKITIHYSSALTSGDYTIDVTTPNGAHDASRFTL